MNVAIEIEAGLASFLVPAAHALPSNAEYLAHLDLAAGNSELIRLSSNESTEPPSPRVREALARSFGDAHLSPPTSPPLRAAVANRYSVPPEAVLLGAGSTELIEATLRAFVRAGDEVVLPSPTWPVFFRRLLALEARIVEVPLACDDRVYTFDLDALLDAVTPSTKLLVVCSPNNPTGNSMPLSDLRRIAETGLPLLVDAAYEDFASGMDSMSLVHEFANVLVSRTFSKAYCLAGLRVGYLVGDPAVVDAVERFLVPGSSVSSASLHAALAAFEDEGYHRSQVERIMAARTDLLVAMRQLGFRAYESNGNFVAVDAGGFTDNARGLAAAMLLRGVLVRPLGDTIVRITVGGERENRALLDALEDVAATSR
jgi:histidinol-phosphate aminotransferase